MTFLKLFCIVLFIVSASSAVPKLFFRRDYVYLEDDRMFVKIHKEIKNWADARSICADEDAALFYPVNRNEGMILEYLQKDVNTTLWLGIHDLFVEGYFETIFGDHISNTSINWQPEQSNNFSGLHCLTYGSALYELDDCEKNIAFVCKKDASNFSYNQNCDTFDPSYYDYTLLNQKCYKLHKTPMTWHAAVNTCNMEFSSLYLLQNYGEAVKLNDTIPWERSSVVDKYFDKSILHSGFHDLFSLGDYLTIKGKPLSSTGYEAWSPFYPKIHDGARCGSVVINGTLQNVDCNMHARFFCERPYVRV